MKTRFMQNEFPHVRISRRTRKKVHRLAHSPAVRGIAAFVPALVAGVNRRPQDPARQRTEAELTG